MSTREEYAAFAATLPVVDDWQEVGYWMVRACLTVNSAGFKFKFWRASRNAETKDTEAVELWAGSSGRIADLMAAIDRTLDELDGATPAPSRNQGEQR